MLTQHDLVYFTLYIPLSVQNTAFNRLQNYSMENTDMLCASLPRGNNIKAEILFYLHNFCKDQTFQLFDKKIKEVL